jgi:predicted dehydrogenase
VTGGTPTGVALIGLGMVSGTYVAALGDLTDRLALRGVHARSPEDRARFLEKHRAALPEGCRAYASVDEIAEDPSVDFVMLATPPNAREEIVRRLAAAGKHVLMEKPVERTLEAARRLCGICEAEGVTLGIVFQHRMRPAAQELARVVTEGRLGALLTIEVAVPWWRPQSYYDEPGRGTYARDGGGVLISQAIHTLDLALSLAGPVAEVIALTGTSGFHRMESEDFVASGWRLDNGALGSFFATTASYPGHPDTIGLNGEQGAALLKGNRLTIDWQDGNREEFGAEAATGGGADPMAFTHEWHREVIADFAAAIREGRPPLVPGREALRVHALIAALERSGREGVRVAVADQ